MMEKGLLRLRIRECGSLFLTCHDCILLKKYNYLIKNFSINYENYDAIIGYRADDSYFSFAQDFINGTISYRQLNRAMYLGKLGQQYEQRQKRINKAQVEYLLNLSKALCCEMECLIEKVEII